VRVSAATGAATAIDLSADLGDQPVTDLVRDDTSGALYASTDFGVLQLPTGGTSWSKAADGLPIVAVYGLTIDPGSRLLYAATHGRGVYRVNLPGGTAAPTQAPTPGPGRSALRGAAATGPSAGTSPVQADSPTSGRPGVRGQAGVTHVRASRAGRTVTVRFQVDRMTKVRVVVRDRRGRVVGRSPLRAARPGHDQTIRVRIPKGTRSPIHARVTAQPEAKAP
jgi:hypothetical protein